MSHSRVYIGAGVIAIAGILFWVLVMPTYDNIMAQRNALEERNAILEKRTAILANIASLTEQYKTRSSDIQKFSSIVPAQKSAPELVSSIQALANQNGLQLIGLSLSAGTIQNQAPYQSQSIDMGLTGNYPSFKEFVLALEKNIRVIDIISIDASPISDNSSIIGFRIKGNAYYLK